LLTGALALWINSRRRKVTAVTERSFQQLTAEEEARIKQLMSAEPAPDQPI
jgi:cytochrome c-type biogenesis protein CcmH